MIWGDQRLPLGRFWSRVAIDESTGCWLWTSPLNKRTGYGQFAWRGKNSTPHRVSYQELVGPIPEDLVIDHLCRVRHCVNPAHMEAVTHQVNLLRGETHAAKNAAKTHCPQGHPLSGENLHVYVGKGVRKRQCKTCRAKESHESYQRRLRARAAARAREAA